MSIDIEIAKTPSGFARGTKRRDALRAGRVLALLLAAPLGACGVQRTLPPPTTPYDYHDRHPVVLSDSPQVLDIFPAAHRGHIDPETMGRIREFMARYREFGHGQVSMLTPVGSPAAQATAADAGAVRHALASAGLGGNILVGTYPVTDPRLAAPIRLSFQSIKAKVADRCGEWPRDLASGTSVDGWQNETYWNFGCASQATLSAQVADPRDLANPRGETASDIETRMRSINKMRRGEDPSTVWRLKATDISSVGGGS
ncbi:CpaD family pilus assembly protein [Methylocystis parvus]|uniref:Pilus assembly protein CpaD n=1 Tax=Methylocystis parvus TaxID=134 RepID=A0A6B8M7Y6_9HYPH|nr:CpaD family pilus assembly protein [Methylocystis parvus]QGM98515.1 pilus assembly protein CpaD [Methylocystis parvus]WBK01146.1 CpaD family pilus assembly protein [Methylocystis parvus OBBP]